MFIMVDKPIELQMTKTCDETFLFYRLTLCCGLRQLWIKSFMTCLYVRLQSLSKLFMNLEKLYTLTLDG